MLLLLVVLLLSDAVADLILSKLLSFLLVFSYIKLLNQLVYSAACSFGSILILEITAP